MTPLRIVIIALLLYIGFRLIFGGRKKSSEKDAETGSLPDKPVEDVLVEDPVCHSLVPMQQAIPLQHGETTIYFCSEKCCNTFIAQEGED